LWERVPGVPCGHPRPKTVGPSGLKNDGSPMNWAAGMFPFCGAMLPHAVRGSMPAVLRRSRGHASARPDLGPLRGSMAPREGSEGWRRSGKPVPPAYPSWQCSAFSQPRSRGFDPPQRKRRRGIGQAFRPGWRAAHHLFFRCFPLARFSALTRFGNAFRLKPLLQAR